MMLFSLILPVYKVEHYIGKCILSCLEQKGINSSEYEIILVDDGSPDHSIDVALDVVRKYPNYQVNVIHRENGGLSAARNTGLRVAKGKYVWFIDSDDWIASDSLSILKNIVEQEDAIDVVTFTHQIVFSDGFVSSEISKKSCQISGFDYLKNNNFLSVCCCLYSNDFLKNGNFLFKEGVYWEDSEFNLRVYGSLKKHFYLGRSLYFYLRREGSITSVSTTPKHLDSSLSNIDSVESYFADKDLAEDHRNVINRFLASYVIGVMSGIDLLSSKEERENIKKIMRKNRFRYYCFFNYSDLFMYKFVGKLILLLPSFSRYLIRKRMQIAIKRGNTKN